MARVTTKVSRRNLPWRLSNNIWVCGPLAPPDADEVRARLVALGRRPEARRAALLQRLDPAAGTMSEVPAGEWPAFAASLVLAPSGPLWEGEDSLVTLAEREQDLPLDGLPFRITLGPDWVTFQFNHALGDSTALWPAFTALMHPTEHFDGFPLVAPQGWRPLRRALWHTFGRRAGDLATVLRSDRAALPLASTGEAQAAPRARAAYGVSEPGYRKKLRADAPERGLSVAALMVARAHVVAGDLGLAVHPGVAMVVDCRRYLPERDYVEGNFIAGSYLDLDDPTDPVEAHRAIEHLVDSGRPLLSMSMSAMFTRRGPVVEEVTAPDELDRSLLSMSHVGRMPWPRGGLEPEITSAMSRSVGDRGIAVITIETRHTLIVSVTWADGHQDPVLMQRFARALVGQPG